jgi:hypothetical protein
MFYQALPSSASGHERSLSALTNGQQPDVGGNLKRGLNRLNKILERRADRQILSAQIQAYDASTISSKPQ